MLDDEDDEESQKKFTVPRATMQIQPSVTRKKKGMFDDSDEEDKKPK